MNEITENYDLTGLKCPLPVLKTKARLNQMKPGEQIWVITTDPMAVIDLPHFCSEYGHLLVKIERGEKNCRFLIEKAA